MHEMFFEEAFAEFVLEIIFEGSCEVGEMSHELIGESTKSFLVEFVRVGIISRGF